MFEGVVIIPEVDVLPTVQFTAYKVIPGEPTDTAPVLLRLT